jgi:hypothetical protein
MVAETLAKTSFRGRADESRICVAVAEPQASGLSTA